MSPPTRSFESFSAAARECTLSRVYLGIHFRYDSTAGVELGERIGRYIVDRYLTARGRQGAESPEVTAEMLGKSH